MVQDLSLDLRRTGGLPRKLARRSSIDPFIVMDVMREANAHEADGRDIIHMEVGQPGTPAPRAAKPSKLSGSVIRMPWGYRPCANASPATTKSVTT